MSDAEKIAAPPPRAAALVVLPGAAGAIDHQLTAYERAQYDESLVEVVSLGWADESTGSPLDALQSELSSLDPTLPVALLSAEASRQVAVVSYMLTAEWMRSEGGKQWVPQFAFELVDAATGGLDQTVLDALERPVGDQAYVYSVKDWIERISEAQAGGMELSDAAARAARRSFIGGTISFTSRGPVKPERMKALFGNVDAILTSVIRGVGLAASDSGFWRSWVHEVFQDLIRAAILLSVTSDSATSETIEKLAGLDTQVLHGQLLDSRAREVLQAIRCGDAPQVEEALRPRLLVAGHDLKFIDLIYPYLGDHVAVQEDRWTGEKRHDASVSAGLLSWADVIWVEWLGYSAAWYSHRVRPWQVLIVRHHRYELLRDAGDHINYDRVSAIVAIAAHTAEGLIERFSIPRRLIRFIPNIYEESRYVQAEPGYNDSRQFEIALVGAIPRLKGLHRALEVLRELRERDLRYKLTIFGRRPEELPWIASDLIEQSYFYACDEMMSEFGLGDSVQYAGWVDLRAELHKYGYVLSTSDLEGSHVSPGEAFMVGSIGLYLKWRGAEYIYPPQFGFDSTTAMADFIARKPLTDAGVMAVVDEARAELVSKQGIKAFLKNVEKIILESI